MGQTCCDSMSLACCDSSVICVSFCAIRSSVWAILTSSALKSKLPCLHSPACFQFGNGTMYDASVHCCMETIAPWQHQAACMPIDGSKPAVSMPLATYVCTCCHSPPVTQAPPALPRSQSRTRSLHKVSQWSEAGGHYSAASSSAQVMHFGSQRQSTDLWAPEMVLLVQLLQQLCLQLSMSFPNHIIQFTDLHRLLLQLCLLSKVSQPSISSQF